MVLEWLYDALFGESEKKSKRKKREEAFMRLEIQEPKVTTKEMVQTGYGLLKDAGKALTLLSPPSSSTALAGTMAKGDLLDKLEKLTFDSSFSYYGNWGGPNYSSSRNFKQGEQLNKFDVNEPSKDGLDELYKQHDIRYSIAMSKDDANQRRKLLREADEKFIDDAEKYLSSGKASLQEKIYGHPSILAFKGKLKLNAGYNVDKIPLDDETEKEMFKYLTFTDTTPRKPLENIKNVDRIPEVQLTMNESSEDEKQPERIAEENTIKIPYKYSPEFITQLYSVLFDDEE